MSTLKNNWYNYFLYKGILPLTLLTVFCLLVSAFLGAQIPKLLIGLQKNYHSEELFYQSIKYFVWFNIGVYANRAVYQICLNKYIKLIIGRTREIVFKTWLSNYDAYSKKSTKEYPQGEVIARIMSDTQALRELLTSGSLGILIDVFFVLSFLASFVSINQTMGVFLAVTEVIAALALVWGGKYMRKVFHNVRKAKGEVSTSVANIVGGLYESYYTDHQNYGTKTGEKSFHNFLVKQNMANVWDSSYYSLAESLYPILLALVVVIFPYSKITEAAIILALVDLIQRSINPIKSIAGKITNIQRAATGIQRIREFTDDLQKGHLSQIGKESRTRSFKELKVEVNKFQYNQIAPTENNEKGNFKPFDLENNEFLGEKGELIGIVGLSGSGKSTLLNIIAGNIIPDKGGIHFVGEDLNDNVVFPGDSIEDMINYREQVGMVSQDSHIFTETLAFNITLKNETPEEFWSFWEWIREKIPYMDFWGVKPHDVISPQTLSMGQNQLISAIRSCFLKKTIVLFDEISSGLDSELEEALREVVLLIQKNSLTIIVAHRLETILGADKIIVMKDGKIVSEGVHQDLLDDSPVYREFLDELN